jgi:tetratricopeptide (TPR) repeat protein
VEGRGAKTIDRTEAVLAWRELEAGVDECPVDRARSHLLELAARPDSPRSWARLTRLYAETGQWEEAMATAMKAVERGIDLMDFEGGGRHVAWVRILFGTPEEARATSTVLLNALGPNDNPGMAWEAVRLSCLTPQASVDPAGTVKKAREVANAFKESATTLDSLALAQYRAGEWASAVDTCAKVLKLREGYSSAWLVLAMAQHRRGEPEAARRSLAKAVELEKSTAWLDSLPMLREERRRRAMKRVARRGTAVRRIDRKAHAMPLEADVIAELPPSARGRRLPLNERSSSSITRGRGRVAFARQPSAPGRSAEVPERHARPCPGPPRPSARHAVTLRS